MNRIEKPEYPVAAIREMMLNALVHRNYMGAHIQIRVYDNEINIWNDGFLPEGITLESLKHQHASKPRNPVIADVCFKGGYIDSWGRGTIKIMEACKYEGLPEPDFKELSGGFLAIVSKNILIEEYLLKLGLNERQLNAIAQVKRIGEITNSEYQLLNDTSRATATRDLQELVDKKILTNKGTKGQGSVYVLIK